MNENELNTIDELARAREILGSGRAVRDARDGVTVDRVMADVRRTVVIDHGAARRVRAARWAVASLSAAAILLVSVVGTLVVEPRRAADRDVHREAGSVPEELTIALASGETATVSGGAHEVRLEHPMRLLVVHGALRMESVTNGEHSAER